MDPAKVLEYCRLLGALKHLKRTGWVQNAVSEPETVASHMYRMGALALLLDPAKVDRDRCIRMCLVHDMGESIVGDITPHCGVPAAEKAAAERAAMVRLSGLVGPAVGAELLGLWEEYEAGATAEAKAVKDLDKFDMLAQAAEYEERDAKPGALQEFFQGTPMLVFSSDSGVTDWVKQLSDERFESMKDKPPYIVGQSDIP